MPVMSYREALTDAYRLAMRKDPRVCILGEDVAGGAGASGQRNIGGIFGPWPDFLPEFGEQRMIDTPISESAIVGTAVGAALCGLRPVAEIMFSDFLGLCLDQIWNQAAKFRYMFGGKARTPLVIRTTIGGGLSAAAQHSQTLYNLFTMVPGLKCVVPSNPYDAKGLLIRAIRDDDPVVFCEHKTLYDLKGEVPADPYTIPLGEAEIVREGGDVTVVALARMVQTAAAAAEAIEKAGGPSCEVIDLRCTSPLDTETILDSIESTGRLVIVDEGTPRCSIARDIAGLVAEQGFDRLHAPIRQVTAPHTPVPFAPELERAFIPSRQRVEEAIRAVAEYRG